MRFPLWSAIALIAFVGCSSPARAEWQVVRVSGTAIAAQSGMAPFRLASGSTVPDDVTIETGSSGRVMLKRETSTIVVAPLSSMTLSDGLFGITTTALQRVGQVDYQVEKREVRYFSVETPSMAAVVKGTRFSVRVARNSSSVSVSRGLVGVTDLASGNSADLAPGQRAATDGQGLHLSGRGKPPVTPGQPRMARVQSMSIKTVSTDVRAATSRAPQSQQGPSGGSARDDDNSEDGVGHGHGHGHGGGNSHGEGGRGHGGGHGGNGHGGGGGHGGHGRGGHD